MWEFKKVIRSFISLVLVLQMCLLVILNSYNLPEAKAATLSTSRVSVHDPSVVKDGNKYYIFGSHMANAVTSDLTSWSTFTTNVKTIKNLNKIYKIFIFYTFTSFKKGI